MIERFHAAYERRYGNRFPYVPVQGVSYRVELVDPAPSASSSRPADAGAAARRRGAAPAPQRTVEIRHLEGERRSPPPSTCARQLASGAAVAGPAVIREGLSTTLLLSRPGRRPSGASASIVIERAMTADPRAHPGGVRSALRLRPLHRDGARDRFGYIVEHMCSRLLTAAFSPILRDFYDFAATLTSPPERGWPTPAMSASILLFTGTMTDSVRNTIEEYGVERLEPGDVIIANDPYRNGTHVNDILFTRPVFHDGAARLLRQHEGPPARHGRDRAGRLQPRQAQRLRERPRALAARALPRRPAGPRDLEPDLRQRPLRRDPRARHADGRAELELGERMILESIERYGLDAVLGAMPTSATPPPSAWRPRWRRIPDGDWVGEDLADADAVADDEEYRVRVRITKRGARAEVDFSGTSRQARSAINATPLDAKTSVGVAFKSIFDPQGWFTSGRPARIDIVIPEGTVISALPPDGAVFAYWEQNQVILSARAARARPGGRRGGARGRPRQRRHPQRQRRPRRRHAVDLGGAGRRRDRARSAPTATATPTARCSPTRPTGSASPSRRSSRARRSSCSCATRSSPTAPGPGGHRGGASMSARLAVAARRQHHLMSLHYKRPSGFGVHGGGDGAGGGIWLWDEGERPQIPPAGPDSYGGAPPVAGVLDPATLAPSPKAPTTTPTACRSGRPAH